LVRDKNCNLIYYFSLIFGVCELWLNAAKATALSTEL